MSYKGKKQRDYFRIKDREPERQAKRNQRQLKQRNGKERKKIVLKAVLKYQAKNKDKLKAHGVVKRALKAEKIKRESCVVCGNSKVIGHHPDYSKPLEVVWLCDRHHKEFHIVERYCLRITGDISQTLAQEKELARKEGYEVGYAQGTSETSAPKILFDEARQEERAKVVEEVRERVETLLEKPRYHLTEIEKPSQDEALNDVLKILTDLQVNKDK